MKTPHKILHECYLKNIKGIESISTPRFPAIHTPAAIEAMQEYARQAVTYALEQAEKDGKVIGDYDGVDYTRIYSVKVMHLKAKVLKELNL